MSKINWTRRDVLALGLGGCILSRGLSRLAFAAPRPGRASGPRHVVVLGCLGGIDAVLTTCPRVASEVETWVDVPYGREAIEAVGNVAVGPHLAAMKPWLPSMAIVNGVRVGTANHETGGLQLSRMKLGPTRQMPSILDIIGSHREGQPLGCLSLGEIDFGYSPGYFFDLSKAAPPGVGPGLPPATLLEELDSTAPADLERMAHIARRQAARLSSRGGPEHLQSARNLLQSAELFELLPHVPAFKLTKDWCGFKVTDPEQTMDLELYETHMQRAVWALQNNLTKCVSINFFGRWDSHQLNLRHQTLSSRPFFAALAKFFQELTTRTSEDGRTLASQTIVVLSSELGRFPALNRLAGKDHFPEAPYLFFGAGIEPHGSSGAPYGGVDRRMLGLPVSLKTGRVERSGHHVTLEDIGTTLLHLVGIDPSVYGYWGKRLTFLERT